MRHNVRRARWHEVMARFPQILRDDQLPSQGAYMEGPDGLQAVRGSPEVPASRAWSYFLPSHNLCHKPHNCTWWSWVANSMWAWRNGIWQQIVCSHWFKFKKAIGISSGAQLIPSGDDQEPRWKQEQEPALQLAWCNSGRSPPLNLYKVENLGLNYPHFHNNDTRALPSIQLL